MNVVYRKDSGNRVVLKMRGLALVVLELQYGALSKNGERELWSEGEGLRDAVSSGGIEFEFCSCVYSF